MTEPLTPVVLSPLVGAQNQGGEVKALRVGVRVDEVIGKPKTIELRVGVTDNADLHRQLGAELKRLKHKSGRIVAMIEDRAVTQAIHVLVDDELAQCRRKEPVTP